MQDRPKLKVSLTAADKFYEVLCAAALAALWGVAVYSYANAPDVVPTHFNFAGEADAFGDKQTVFIMPVIGTFLFTVLTLLNNYPYIFNYPVKITPQNALQQYTHATRMIRHLRLAIMLLFIIIESYTYAAATGRAGDFGDWLLPVAAGLVFIPLLWYLVKVFRPG